MRRSRVGSHPFGFMARVSVAILAVGLLSGGVADQVQAAPSTTAGSAGSNGSGAAEAPQPRTFVAEVTMLVGSSSSSAPVTEGTATFVADGTALQGCEAVPLTAAGTATCTTTALPAGLNFPTVVINVTVGVTGPGNSSVNTSMGGEPITLRIAVSDEDGATGGTVSVTSVTGSEPQVADEPLAGCSDVPVTDGVASCALGILTAGSARFQASFTPAASSDQQFAFAKQELDFDPSIGFPDFPPDLAPDLPTDPDTLSASDEAADPCETCATAAAAGPTLALTGAEPVSASVLGFSLVVAGLGLIAATRLRRRPLGWAWI